MLSQNLEKTLREAYQLATNYKHEYVTLEHLLYSLLEDQDAISVLKACAVDITNLKESVENVLAAREKVVMVRLNKESLIRIDELVESQLVKSRSEGAAFLIGEGIQRRHGLFDRIAQKVENIRKAKEELHNLLAQDESLDNLDTNNSNHS